LASTRLERHINENLGKELELKIIPKGALGSEDDLLKMLDENKVEMALISFVIAAEKYPKMNLFSLPYAFPNLESAFHFLESPSGQGLVEDYNRETGLHWLSFLSYGVREFATTKNPILEPADLEGVSFRVPTNPIIRQTYEAFKAIPRELVLPDVLPALRAGRIEGTDIAVYPLWELGYHEVIRHISITGLFAGVTGFLVSNEFWNFLGQENQKELIALAEEAAQFGRVKDSELNAQAVHQLESAGLHIHYPDKSAFRDKVKPVWEAAKEWIRKDWLDELDQFWS
jgi:TRAP-type C4-dicarboxylate transport system substrate-binding protein